MGINEELQARTALKLTMNKYSSFVLSVDGMLGEEAKAILTTLSQLMTPKMEEPILKS